MAILCFLHGRDMHCVVKATLVAGIDEGEGNKIAMMSYRAGLYHLRVIELCAAGPSSACRFVPRPLLGNDSSDGVL